MATNLQEVVGLTQSNVLKDIHKLEPLVKEILSLPQKLHDKAKRLQSIELPEKNRNIYF
jgi:hypothetical protein